MAFLDNSGDIILDAVLTDLGRKRMSEGNFRITQFTLGDDEIDYSLYNKNHPSGSAYYDLEILQTPVFEAFTRTNANINYGLASYNGNQNLLYLPSMKLNTKQLSGRNVDLFPASMGVVYFSAGNNGSGKDTDTALAGGSALGTSVKFLSKTNDNVILFETGLDSQGSDALSRDSGTRTSYVENNSLEDLQFTILADERVFSAIRQPNGTFDWPPGPASSGASAISGYSLASSGTRPSPIPLSSGTQQIENYGFATLSGQPNTLTSNSDNDDLKFSVINGPRGGVGIFSLALNGDLGNGTANVLYARLGRENQNLFGDGNTYDYLDTLVYIRGDVTGVTLQVPIRVIRKV